MNARICRVLLVLLTLLVLAAPAFSQDIRLDRQGFSNVLGTGARALGMGGAFIAIADDATASSWNPAGLAVLSRPEISFVYSDFESEQRLDYDYLYTFQDWDFNFDPNNPDIADLLGTLTDVDDRTRSSDSSFDFVSATYPLFIRNRPVVAQFSYRKLASFPGVRNDAIDQVVWTRADDGTTPYPDQRREFSFVTNDAGAVDNYSLSLATTLANRFNAGVTLNYLDTDIATRELSSGMSAGAPYTDISQTSLSFAGYFFDIGVQYNYRDRVFLGAVYHSDLSENATYSDYFYLDLGADYCSEVPDDCNYRSSGKSRVKLPDSWGVGLAFKPVDRFLISVDYSETNWSQASIQNFIPAGSTIGFDAGFPTFGSEQFDTSAIRVGAEYVVRVSSRLLVPVRAGYFEEEQIANRFGGSQPTYDGYSLGFGLAFGRWQLDLAYVDSSGTEPGVLDGIEIPGLTITTRAESLDYSSERLIVSTIIRF